MKLEPWEPDLQTLMARIDDGELNLQPDFQRGIAWNRTKQQRLIDTVLRGWAVPPVHLIVQPDERLSVLDGQQRLYALKLFLDDKLAVDGKFPPDSPSLEAMDGRLFSELDEPTQRRIRNFKIIAYRLYDYDAGEPYELFFRLNLPTGLTQAEKRNALIGSAHQQVKTLVSTAIEEHGWSKDLLGFSNARLAYDDALARACAYVDAGTLRFSLSAKRLEELYREDRGFREGTIRDVEIAIDLIAYAARGSSRIRLNKATLLTWLVFAARLSHFDEVPAKRRLMSELVGYVELSRVAVRRGKLSQVWLPPGYKGGAEDHALVVQYLDLFNDRASSRVNDVISVVARDLVAWRLAALMMQPEKPPPPVSQLLDLLRPTEQHVDEGMISQVLQLLEDSQAWGSL